MLAVQERPKVTSAELLARPDCNQYELVNGELVERNTGWQSSRIASHLATLLGVFVQQQQLGWVNVAGAGYRCYLASFPEDPDRIRKPDISFIRIERLAPEDEPEGYCEIVPDLVVEVVSPNDTIYELSLKIDEYRKAGVKLIWVVVPNTKTVTIHRLDGSTQELRESDELSGEDVVPGFRCPVAEIFRTPVRPRP
ncbi:MAG: Uma2 family endonuclease [Planctomycetaceae bacterium]